jgi:hypothetical protein
MEKYVAFDIETSQKAPDDRASIGKLDITCVGYYISGEQHTLKSSFYGDFVQGVGFEVMKELHINRVVCWLWEHYKQGYQIVSWNGMGFDFPVLAGNASARYKERVETIAWGSYDPAFHMLCEKGFMIGLGSYAEVNDLGVKTMDGLEAVEKWSLGFEEQLEVIEYVKHDALLTARAWEKMNERGAVEWITRSGKSSVWQPSKRFLPVEEAYGLPLPDTSWMDNPFKREEFYDWMEHYPAVT